MRRIVQRCITTIQITSIEIRWDDEMVPDGTSTGASFLELPAGAADPRPIRPRKRKPKARLRRGTRRAKHAINS